MRVLVDLDRVEFRTDLYLPFCAVIEPQDTFNGWICYWDLLSVCDRIERWRKILKVIDQS